MKSALALLILSMLATTSLAQDHPAVTALPNSVYVGADYFGYSIRHSKVQKLPLDANGH